MTDKTFNEELNDVKTGKNNIVKLGLTMNDVPLFLYKEFVSDIKKYNNVYWVKLLDLIRKAEAYDYIVQQGFVPDMLEEPEKEQVNEEVDSVMTMGGRIPLYKKGD